MATVPLGKIASDGAAVSAAPNTARPIDVSSESWQNCLSPSLMDEWETLVSEAVEPNPFYEPWHLQAALKACDPSGSVELVQFREGGQLCALLPVKRSFSYYGYPVPHLRGWLHDNAFCGAPLVKRGHETAFWTALHEWASLHSKSALFIHLEHLAEDGPLFRAFSHCAPRWGHAVVVHRAERAMLQSPQSADDYFAASMSGKKRKELRRQFSRLSELGHIAIHRETGADGVTRWIDTFLALEAAGWKGKAGSALASNLDTEQLFREALTGAARANRLERLSITLDGRAIAMLVNLVSPPGVFSFKTTFDEHYARFSPGVLLQRENLKLLDDPAIEWADSCAAADHPMIERIWREKRSVVRVNWGLGGTIRQAAFKQLSRAESGSESLGE